MQRIIDDEYGGFEWSPSDMSSPHGLDFKTLLVDPQLIEQIVRWIATIWDDPDESRWHLCLNDFTPPRVSYRFYKDSTKKGFFIQAGCIVTDGFGRRGFSHLLLSERSKDQFHDSGQQRYTTGLSCVIGTPLVSPVTLDSFGHVPAVVFNDICSYCPWAIFSRKLLAPDVYVESRFLGLGYNFKNPDRRYLFLVWHVKTKNIPDVMVVDARRRSGDAEHDRMTWVPSSRWKELRLAPVDDGVLRAIMEDERRPHGDRIAGYVPIPRFESISRTRWQFETVNRDEIILDLLRIIQRDIHSGRGGIERKAGARREESFHNYLIGRLDHYSRSYQLSCELVSKPQLGWGPGKGEPDLLVTVNDADGKRLFRYIIEIKVNTSDVEPSEYRNQAERYRSAVMAPDLGGVLGKVDAIILIQGIWPETAAAAARIDVVALEADITIPYPFMPVHVVRVHLAPPSPSRSRGMKEIAHALIPIARDGLITGLLFARGPDEPGFQPLGGKVDGFESPELAMRRELEEETVELGGDRIIGSDIAEAIPLFPGSEGKTAGLTRRMRSPTSKRMTSYRFHPFLLNLTDAAKRRVGRGLSGSLRSLRVVALDEWAAGGRGYDPAYALAVIPLLSEEKLVAAAVETSIAR